MLSRERVRAIYDRRGARQDRRGAFTEAAVEVLLARGEFASVSTVYELGCGTGQLAERLLALHLPVTAAYTGVDLSPRMVALARERLDRFGGRAHVRLTDGDPRIETADDVYDRVIAAYVLELLPSHEITALIDEAHRVLVPGGRLCIACLDAGDTPLANLVGGVRRVLGAVAPAATGGIEPIDLGKYLDAGAWSLLHTEVVTRLAVRSRVVIARK